MDATTTTAQRVTLRAAIFADPTAAAFVTAGNVPGLMAWCNTDTTTLRWLNNVEPQVIDEAGSLVGYDAILPGLRDAWVRFLAFPRDFAKARNRAAITEVWGAATAGSKSEKYLLAGTVLATKAQTIIGGTTETEGSVTALDAKYNALINEVDAGRLIFKDNGTKWTAAG